MIGIKRQNFFAELRIARLSSRASPSEMTSHPNQPGLKEEWRQKGSPVRLLIMAKTGKRPSRDLANKRPSHPRF
jgi:hypothetical protein